MLSEVNEKLMIGSTKTSNENIKPSSVVPLKSIFVFLCATLLSALIYEIYVPFVNDVNSLWNTLGLQKQSLILQKSNLSKDSFPSFAVYGKSKSEDHLVHVFSVLERFGYRRTSVDNDWDLLWGHDYPFFQMSQRLKNLKNYQKVNHWPGCGFITNKVDLSITNLPFLPKAFRLPSEKNKFLQYAQENPNALFVKKHNEHRNIEIMSVSEINLNENNSFVQEFIQNPFLVDGYKFDIGVYVAITSIDPLRVYMYTGDVLFRYCTVKYHPFNPNITDKYIVGDDYLPTWKVPSLIKYYTRFSASMRDAFDAYVRDQSKDPSYVWTQVEDILRETILSKENDMKNILKAYKTRNFFELLRFDFIVDVNLKVILMEANMSPNLSSAHYEQNSLLYEQVLYNVMNLVGIGSPVRRNSLSESSEIEDMIVAEKNLVTYVNLCVEHNCDKDCSHDQCELCLPCLDESNYEILKNAFREHLHKMDMKRIFPKSILKQEHFDINKEVQNLSLSNQWMSRWFYGKCLNDPTWCF